MNHNTARLVAESLVFTLAMMAGAAAVFGWVLNIIKLADSPFLTGMVVARALGALLAPVGAVLGYF